MKTVALTFLLILGSALGSPQRKPAGLGAAKGLPGYPNPFIVGGEVVNGRQYPGQISLQYGDSHNCGGSIINENYIVTAGHCSDYQPSMLSVWSGSNLLSWGGTRHQVTKIITHEKYNPRDSWHNDIAVMKVDPPFVFDENTAPVSLPGQGQETPVDSVATVIGWGRLSYGGPIPDDLRKVDIYISDHAECDRIYSEDGLRVYDEQICADHPKGDMGSCNGDSGGPLFVNGQVVGLVSWARGCATLGFPTVYTEVADYIDWINSKVNQ